MKKLLSLQSLMLMGLAVGSTYMVSAKEACNKQEAPVMSHESQDRLYEKGHRAMVEIEAGLHEIERACKHSRDGEKARMELKAYPDRIKEAVKNMRESGLHTNMVPHHKNTLKRHLDAAHRYVDAHCSKN